ncbi:aldo/keto reductase (plasmid) [Nocardia sp. NBC_01377]|uniref:aldo/keto reductase n=1 Tax=Nocardia sp. NBC_01377 TaxID=2903595 RepID=UPI00324C4122
MDTAFNYRDFTSQRRLAAVAGDLLAQFTISTKVGFFPNPHGRPVHSLDPARLATAVEQSCQDLGRIPDVVLLHNPEHSLTALPTDQAGDLFAAACAALADAVSVGLAREWGISSWNPAPVLGVIRAGEIEHRPSVVMVRVGLTLPDPALTAACELGEAFAIPPDRRWGMSPFAGSTTDQAWRTTNLSPLVTGQPHPSTPQAAFRLTYELPPVTRVAVSTSDATHLRELVTATGLDVDDAALHRYRALLRTGT